MFSRGGQSHPKETAVDLALDHRVAELEHVVDHLEARLDAVETALGDRDPGTADVVAGDGELSDAVASDQPSAGDADSESDDAHEARVHFLPLGIALTTSPAGEDDIAGVADAPTSVVVQIEPAVDEARAARIDDELVDARARLDATESEHERINGRLAQVVHSVELLAMRVDELAHKQRAQLAEPPPAAATDYDLVAALRELQLAQARLAVEQARTERLFREDLVTLTERVRRLARPPA